jgi:SAM-dependent methyltransferase
MNVTDPPLSGQMDLLELLDQMDRIDCPPLEGGPWLLDACCGVGGATKGYQDAGFKVLGVDIEPAAQLLRRRLRPGRRRRVHPPARPPVRGHPRLLAVPALHRAVGRDQRLPLGADAQGHRPGPSTPT